MRTTSRKLCWLTDSHPTYATTLPPLTPHPSPLPPPLLCVGYRGRVLTRKPDCSHRESDGMLSSPPSPLPPPLLPPSQSASEPEGLLQALLCLRAEIRVATSSMTSVPKPLKILREHFAKLRETYDKMVRITPSLPPSLLLTHLSHDLSHDTHVTSAAAGDGRLASAAGRRALCAVDGSRGRGASVPQAASGRLPGEGQLLRTPLHPPPLLPGSGRVGLPGAARGHPPW